MSGVARSGSRPRRRTLTRRLLVSINLTVAVILGAFMVWSYRAQWQAHLHEKATALNEEAQTLLPAVARVRSQGSASVQSLIDDVCGAMREATSPGHHIAVQMGNETLQAHAHHRASPVILAAMQQAVSDPARMALLEDEFILVGSAAEGNVTVYVSEYISILRKILHSQLIGSIGILVALGVTIAVVVNVMLRRLLLRPVHEMAGTVRRFGAGELQARMPHLDTEELSLLAEEFDRMAAVIERAEAERRGRMEKARRIQDNLRPDLGALKDLRSACIFQPAAEVAGDYYDVLTLADGSVLLCIADVTGHGVPAAMDAAMLKALLHTFSDREKDPQKLLQLLDAAFQRVALPEDFATMLLARWDRQARSLSLANAGHVPGLLVRSGGSMQAVSATGPPLGVEEGSEWETAILQPAAGDRFVLFTDGLTETASADGGLFGQERLENILEKTASKPLSDLPDRIIDEVKAFRGPARQTDDLTLLAVEF